MVIGEPAKLNPVPGDAVPNAPNNGRPSADPIVCSSAKVL